MYYPSGEFEYFDLASNPTEKHPIISDQLIMRFDVLTGDYLDMWSDFETVNAEVTSQQLELLKSIGYLQGVEDPVSPAGE
jgi:hypothetical protein